MDSLNNEIVNLYAKNFTEKSFSLKVPLTNGGSTRLILFSASSHKQNNDMSKGVMIEDEQCFKNLIVLIKSIQLPLVAEAKAQADSNSSTSSKITISGFILAV